MEIDELFGEVNVISEKLPTNKNIIVEELSTTTGCPICKNEAYLVQCYKTIWKVCDKCKTIFKCDDAYDTFTDQDIVKYLEINPGKKVNDYITITLAYLNDKYADYKSV